MAIGEPGIQVCQLGRCMHMHLRLLVHRYNSWFMAICLDLVHPTEVKVLFSLVSWTLQVCLPGVVKKDWSTSTSTPSARGNIAGMGRPCVMLSPFRNLSFLWEWECPIVPCLNHWDIMWCYSILSDKQQCPSRVWLYPPGSGADWVRWANLGVIWVTLTGGAEWRFQTSGCKVIVLIPFILSSILCWPSYRHSLCCALAMDLSQH